MTQVTSKIFSVVTSLLFVACALGGGSKPPKNIKIYEVMINNDWCLEPWCQGKEGLFRAQAKEYLGFVESEGYLCMTRESLRLIQSSCPKP